MKLMRFIRLWNFNGLDLLFLFLWTVAFLNRNRIADWLEQKECSPGKKALYKNKK